MATTTYALQKRVATVSNLSAKYQVEMGITARGDLPDRGVFLKTIVTDDDPKEDTLLRVCRPGDIITYADNRDQALNNRETYWRDTSIVKFYDTVSQARVAADFLKERVNALVSEYSEYLNEFKADPGETLAFPQQGMGVFSPLIKAYELKTADRIAQTSAVQTTQDACAQTSLDYATSVAQTQAAQDTLAVLLETRTTVQAVRVDLMTQHAGSTTLGGLIEQTLSAWDNIRASADTSVQVEMDPTLKDPTGTLYDEYSTAFKTSLTAITQRVAALDAKLVDLGESIALQTGRAQVAKNKRDSLALAKEVCGTEVAQAQAALEAIERTEADLLAEISSLCPDFTP